MSTRTVQAWVPYEKIETLVQLEPALIIFGLAMSAWVVSKVIYKKLSAERQRNLSQLLRNLTYHLLFGTGLFLMYEGLLRLPLGSLIIERITTYIGLATILSGSIVFVKAWRVLVLEYLFISHLRVAFPVLLVNLFTLLLSIILGGWLCAEIFNIRLTPLLATSAIFSLVMGLALQDTLGNLFAGVALQFDKPYEIGDWIEIQTSGQKWTGQVYEISWRATVLISFTEEFFTVPNRVMSQAQISNYSTKYRPIIRSLIFRLPFGADINQTKDLLTHAAKSVSSLRKLPSPFVIVSETTESWIAFKLVYFIDNFGDQFLIADRVYSAALPLLKKAGYELSGHKVKLAGHMTPNFPDMTVQAAHLSPIE